MNRPAEMTAEYPFFTGVDSSVAEPRLIDIGVGAHPLAGSIGIDIRPVAGAAIVANAMSGLPFRTSSIDGARASHVIEHLTDPIPLFREVWRVLRPGGTLLAITPHFSSPLTVWSDPTHQRPFSSQSWVYLDASAFGNYADGFDLRVVATYLRRQTGPRSTLSDIAERLANFSPTAVRRAEAYWAGLSGGFSEVQVFLTAVK